MGVSFHVGLLVHYVLDNGGLEAVFEIEALI